MYPFVSVLWQARSRSLNLRRVFCEEAPLRVTRPRQREKPRASEERSDPAGRSLVKRYALPKHEVVFFRPARKCQKCKMNSFFGFTVDGQRKWKIKVYQNFVFQGFYCQLCSHQVQIRFKHISTTLPRKETILDSICNTIFTSPEQQSPAKYG